jgi:N-acetylglucosamine-6-phosphate deacetylase
MPPTPEFFDLQINGYAGVDFNQDNLTPEQLDHACQKLDADGVTGILATVITDTLPAMRHRLANLVRCREQSPLARQIIAGIHIEGPFLSPVTGYRGAHPADAIQPADESVMQSLLESAAGLTRLVTLAPEQDAEMKVTRLLRQSGITISAGHTDATLDQLKASIDAGLTLFTHLGNGCPQQMHRHDNIIQRVMSLRDSITPTLIADGVHLPFFVLKNFLDHFGIDRCIIVTDAIAPAGLGPGRYTLARWDLLIGPDMVARSPDGSHFVGSAITMPQSADNLATQLTLTESQIKTLTSINPARHAAAQLRDNPS